MTRIPPSRWKVVERGRRLEVIDTQSGVRIGAAPPPVPSSGARPARPVTKARPAPAERDGVWLRKVSFDGTSDLTTHRLYDDKGPRTVRLDPLSARIAGLVIGGIVLALTALIVSAVFWPAILLVLVPLFQGNIRAPLRRAVTQWLDARETGAA
ncbi:hypothetical protein D9601_10985 [Sphingomonas sp. MA1305]|uniref:hypothetical protein n=1 Tax=Sphingomonas sp. MA1305 TaxID=2479204 RepID=UPI0018DFDB0D|nr:hypothetical protein [Sphingomonas sp. MA1305]MBI0475876.1 hypothetical protein [Sphingomonas sp. MA1305]